MLFGRNSRGTLTEVETIIEDMGLNSYYTDSGLSKRVWIRGSQAIGQVDTAEDRIHILGKWYTEVKFGRMPLLGAYSEAKQSTYFYSRETKELYRIYKGRLFETTKPSVNLSDKRDFLSYVNNL